ncbi:MAG: DUF3131 domain-containing protein [Pseudomonadota bacterium]
MSFAANLIKARSNLAFLTGLCIAAGVALAVERRGDLASVMSGSAATIQRSTDALPIAERRPITAADEEAAATAWAYFAANTQTTGLANSANSYPSTTMWDQASYLMGLISAHRLGIVSDTEFNDRVARNLDSLARIPLFDDLLPNKAYNTITLEMTDYTNTAQPRGIGWSALDVARIAVPLSIILYNHPEHAARAAALLSHWRFDAMMRDGQFYGARVNEETDATELVQEGRLGYEEYGARALALVGVDSILALSYDRFLKYEDVSGIEIAVDSRTQDVWDANNYVVSEPYILTGIEFGFDVEGEILAERVYRAQESRYRDTGILTAVSEDNLDQEPYFIYNTVYANGKAWNAISESNEDLSHLRTLSAKAAFGWDVLFDTEYTRRLRANVESARSDSFGWFAGTYESDGRSNEVATANTNGIILETIAYRAFGPLMQTRYADR